MLDGTVDPRSRIYHLLRSNNLEIVQAPNRIQDAEGAQMGRERHGFAEIFAHHDVIRISVHGGLHVHKPQLHAGEVQFIVQGPHGGRGGVRGLQAALVGLRHGNWGNDHPHVRHALGIRQQERQDTVPREYMHFDKVHEGTSGVGAI